MFSYLTPSTLVYTDHLTSSPTLKTQAQNNDPSTNITCRNPHKTPLTMIFSQVHPYKPAALQATTHLK